jgi:hypothetical protein
MKQMELYFLSLVIRTKLNNIWGTIIEPEEIKASSSKFRSFFHPFKTLIILKDARCYWRAQLFKFP